MWWSKWKQRALDYQTRLRLANEECESLGGDIASLTEQLTEALAERDTARKQVKSAREHNDAIGPRLDKAEAHQDRLEAELTTTRTDNEGLWATIKLADEAARDRAAEILRVTEQRDQAWRGIAAAQTAANCIGIGWVGEFNKVVLADGDPDDDAEVRVFPF